MSIFSGRQISLSVAAGLLTGAFLLVQTPTVQAAPAMAGVSSSRGLITTPVAEVGHRYHHRHHRKYRHARYRNNNGAAIAGVTALGVIAAVAAANSAPRYREPVQYGYVQEPVYGYAAPVQYGYADDGYYEQQQYYHAPRHHRRYHHGYVQQHHYYDKESAKQYWRAQKEAQKRAIKQGYYSQPQQYYGRQQYNQPSISGHNSYDYAPGQRAPGFNSYYNNR